MSFGINSHFKFRRQALPSSSFFLYPHINCGIENKLVPLNELSHKSLYFSKVLRPEKLAAHLFEVDEDVEKDEVSPPIQNFI